MRLSARRADVWTHSRRGPSENGRAESAQQRDQGGPRSLYFAVKSTRQHNIDHASSGKLIYIHTWPMEGEDGDEESEPVVIDEEDIEEVVAIDGSRPDEDGAWPGAGAWGRGRSTALPLSLHLLGSCAG